MIHLMEVPNPDPTEVALRPVHGGRDRHACFGVASVDSLVAALQAAGVPFTRSASGRAAVFFRDPDGNTLECVELEPWR
jgi:glyoxylase I family protein